MVPQHLTARTGNSSIPRVTGKSTAWLRYTWQTATLGADSSAASSDLIRPATREEAEQVLHVIRTSLAMDSSWNDALAQADAYLKETVSRLFNAEEPLCLVIPKGNRLIAASLLDPDAGSANHLASGPVVHMEYRNRGIGSRLLHASLTLLRDRGLTAVSGVTRAGSVAADHVYPKFGGVAEPGSLPEGSGSSLPSKR